MKITQEADYGLRVVLHLCKIGNEERVEAKVVAEQEGIPLRFLLKLLRKLIQHGIVKSYRGVAGGYALDKTPENITLREVIEAIDGPISVNRCTVDSNFCNINRTGSCIIHKAMRKVQGDLLKELEGITFKNLLEEALK